MIAATVLLIKHGSDYYRNAQLRYDNEVMEKIAAETKGQQDYKSIVDNYLTDFIVYESADKKVVFSSLNESVAQFQNQINANAKIISKKDVLNISTGAQEYQAIVITYNLPPQDIFNYWIIIILFLEVLMLSIVALALVIIFRKYVRPVNRLNALVSEIAGYQLDFIEQVKHHSEYDAISQKLVAFSDDLKRRLGEANKLYNEVEMELLQSKELLVRKNQVLVSLIHDLKTPLIITRLQLENYAQEKGLDLKAGIDDLNATLVKMNEIGQYGHSDNLDFINKQELINLSGLIMDCYFELGELYDKKGFNVNFDLDDNIDIKTNLLRFKQLVYNILSNIYYHGQADGDVNIKSFLVNNELHLEFYNDTLINTSTLEGMNDLFFSTGDEHNSGIGLFTIKSVVTELGGTIEYCPKAKGLLIEVVIPFAKIS